MGLLPLLRETLALLMGGERVVVLPVAEGRLRAAERVRRHGRALAAGVDAGLRLGLVHRFQPGVVLPRLGPSPLGTATELPAAGVALAHASSSATSGLRAGKSLPPSASTTSRRAAKLWPLTSASIWGAAATIPPARTEKCSALT